jgi:hypothetical protein
MENCVLTNRGQKFKGFPVTDQGGLSDDAEKRCELSAHASGPIEQSTIDDVEEALSALLVKLDRLGHDSIGEDPDFTTAC